MSPRFFYRSPLNHYTLLANSSLQKRNSASDSNLCFYMVYAETKNSYLRMLVSRCNRSVDQPGLEPGTSRL